MWTSVDPASLRVATMSWCKSEILWTVDGSRLIRKLRQLSRTRGDPWESMSAISWKLLVIGKMTDKIPHIHERIPVEERIALSFSIFWTLSAESEGSCKELALRRSARSIFWAFSVSVANWSAYFDTSRWVRKNRCIRATVDVPSGSYTLDQGKLSSSNYQYTLYLWINKKIWEIA